MIVMSVRGEGCLLYGQDVTTYARNDRLAMVNAAREWWSSMAGDLLTRIETRSVSGALKG